MVDFLLVIIELFACSYGSDVISRYWSKLVFFKRGLGHFKCKFHGEGDIAHQPLLVLENWSDYPFLWYQNIDSVFFHFITKHAREGQTDGGQNYNPQDRASIATWHSKN